ncbi:YchJ family protein [Salinicola sp. CPA57]|uniref:YchJ family protein n=1 Tax=Salinicola sp. CPA57 TaxID=1949080 RepID=UPI000DA2271B|nr:YchJ family protein [Salinicola sp. CPA57]
MNVPTTASETLDSRLCPCGSHNPYARCCAIYHLGEAAAPTAEALMRSRYTAFALGGLGGYLVETWDADTIDPALTAEQLDRQENQWLGLEILDARESGARGTVEFKARFRPATAAALAAPQVLHERSRFSRHRGIWRYLDGIIDPPADGVPVSRNAPCPCGSGKKAKRCCLR